MLMEILHDREIVELLGLVHKSIINYFKFYSDSSGLMVFDK